MALQTNYSDRISEKKDISTIVIETYATNIYMYAAHSGVTMTAIEGSVKSLTFDNNKSFTLSIKVGIEFHKLACTWSYE